MMTIREYEKIFSADCPHFDELAKFAQASGFLSLSWRYVQAKNYVGVICLSSDFQIEILPKLDAPDDKLRGLVVEMLRTCKDLPGKKFFNASLDTARLELHEIFISVYLETVSELIKHGLKSSYVVNEDNMNFFKGKLLVNENFRRNFAHREKFFVAYDEYGIDCPEHRLIKATLIKILRTTHDQKNFRLTTQLLADFDSIPQSDNFAKDFSRLTHDRNNRTYEFLMAWTKIFLRGKSFTSFAGKHEAQALLFPMEKLFEDFIAEHVKKIFSDRFSVRTQIRENFLFDAPSNRYSLKPDILLESPDEKIILDTKWKLKISEDDMYQMFAYAKRYGAKKIFIICPPSDDDGNFFRSNADNLSVKIFRVDLFNVSTSLNKLF